jgi:hypothetical protein
MAGVPSPKKTLIFYWDNPPWPAGLYDSDLIHDDTPRRSVRYGPL